MKILTAEQTRQMDRDCIKAGTPVSVLMENAGKAVAEETVKSLGNIKKQSILCLIGAGNNGGDGLVAARYLQERGAGVSVYLCSERPADDDNLKLVREKNITCNIASEDKKLEKFDSLLASATCVIDALLGTGKMRPLQGVYKDVLSKINEVKRQRNLYIVAVDLPSGMDADTGAVDDACPYADMTVTFAFPKIGLYTFPGAARVGNLKIADIGIPASLADGIPVELMTRQWVRDILPERPLNANKGTFGKVLVVAGSIKYIGAAYLACSGAMRVGAGLVTLATASSLQPVLASKLTEATYLPLPEAEPGVISAGAAEIVVGQCRLYDVLLLGCGLGQSPATVEFVNRLISQKDLPPLVLDADALNILWGIPDWQSHLADNTIITPHPGEMSRLSGLSIDEIQSDRIGIAGKYAAAWHQTIVLKGAYTVVATTDGCSRVSPFANPGLASAGTGDVLAGAIAGISAQGLSPFDAASLGVYLHGETGEMIKNVLGDTGMIASDLLMALPAVINRIKSYTNSGGG
jgi:hydroxyethylthiazole kinase-like uncharacterized protein yjeF